jgi:eukaryotic-like serine/threonine-protein kinase
LESKAALDEQRYEVGEPIGHGAMGEVLRATDRSLKRDVAIKTLRGSLQEDAESVARFVREARAVGRLQHPNIPPVHELGTTQQGLPYFSMRLVQGETLSEVIRRLREGDLATHAHWTFARRVQVVQNVCDAVHYAHSLGILHRDLKPDNIMVGPFGEVQVMDWGLARPFRHCEQTAELAGATRAGIFVGTPAYAAPEQIAGESDALDPRADVYGLGVLLYELCTLHPPFTGANAQQIMTAVLSKRPAKPESYSHPVQGRVPRELSVLILQAMASLPEERMESAAELKRRLQEILEGEAAPVCPHTALKRNMTRLDKFMDNHNSPLTIGLIYLWLVSPVLLLLALIVTR